MLHPVWFENFFLKPKSLTGDVNYQETSLMKSLTFGSPERDKSLLILHPLSMCSGHCKTKELSELKLFSWFDVIFGNQCQIAKAIYHAKVQKTRHMQAQSQKPYPFTQWADVAVVCCESIKKSINCNNRRGKKSQTDLN